MTEEEFFQFAKQVEANLVAHDPLWAEYPFGTEAGLLEQYGQTFDDVGTIFYYEVAQTPEEVYYRATILLDMNRGDGIPIYDGIPIIEDPSPPTASDIVWYGPNAPETPALSPIWFDTDTGDIRIWYNFEGGQTWVNTGVAGVGKIEFLNDLQDVDVLTVPVEDEEFLKFNASEAKWLPYDLNAHLGLTYSAIDHVHPIDDLSNVEILDPESEHILSYDGTTWRNIEFAGLAVHYGTSPPAEPDKFPIWFNTTSGFTAIYYDDGDSQQWIDIGGTDSRVTTSGLPQSAFSRVASSYIVNADQTWVVIDYQTAVGVGVYDTDLNFSDGNNAYTCPVDGIYTFTAYGRFDGMSHSSYAYFSILKNDNIHVRSIEGSAESTNYQSMFISCQAQCVAGDVFNVKFFDNSDSSITVSSDSYFSMTLEHEM